MHNARHNDDEQAMLWNGTAGDAWIEMQTVLDRMFESFADLLVEAVSATSGRRVLDVGCGTGATTLAVAQAVGEKGCSLGIDVSEPMIEVARVRAEREGSRARFVCADVQTHAFEPAGFDTIVSRFGVMFFDDPVRAFTNLRRAATDEAGLHVIAWRSPADNPFMTTATRAAAPLLPDLPVHQPDAPGQFGFADRDRVRSILDRSGWTEVDIQRVDMACTLPETELVRYFTRLGPLGRVLHGVDERTRNRVVETVRAAFDPYVSDGDVRFIAACWMIAARASSPVREAEVSVGG